MCGWVYGRPERKGLYVATRLKDKFRDFGIREGGGDEDKDTMHST